MLLVLGVLSVIRESTFGTFLGETQRYRSCISKTEKTKLVNTGR